MSPRTAFAKPTAKCERLRAAFVPYLLFDPAFNFMQST